MTGFDPERTLAGNPHLRLRFGMFIVTRSMALALICLLAGASASAAPTLRCPPGHIDWARVPSASYIGYFYPPRTDLPPTGGSVTLACVVNDAGLLTVCKVASEAPLLLGFGHAALRLVKFFRVARPGCPLPGRPVRVPIRFVTPSG